MPCTKIKESFPRDTDNVFSEDGVLKTDLVEKQDEWNGMKSKDYFMFDKSKNLISTRTLQNTIIKHNNTIFKYKNYS